MDVIPRIAFPLLFSALGLAWTASAAATDIDHFKGKRSDTLSDAVANFSEYNGRLAALLAKDALSPADLGTVHELTYTLEVALARINAEMTAAAVTLEAVHKASERADSAAVKAQSDAYLKTVTTVMP